MGAPSCSLPEQQGFTFSWASPVPSQVLCVFNNSQTVRAPLALALSVNDCKSWEPLAIIEEDPKGGWGCCLCPSTENIGCWA